ncbi:hypothetical protein [endosymbiont GvMRE of Glomus versiforme]|uniref:hypothetical protein n=1 Tax=endosymbiont GvMRE of Glomus versiforme TaxID=2039283 RepID=UPI000EE0E5E4|nr:hypothetical protein [endosymbiont GvMRE of Glomus versiforme]RHZ37183.1 hypothetical protein GvMRE_I1g274 [endosymbiont GvMRE of Glomus versiforme]
MSLIEIETSFPVETFLKRCVRCKKKIRPGEGVAKTSGLWRNEIICKKCAKNQVKRNKIAMILLIVGFFVFIFVGLLCYYFSRK